MQSFQRRHVWLFVAQLAVAAAGLAILVLVGIPVRGLSLVEIAFVMWVVSGTIWVLWVLDRRKVAAANPEARARLAVADLTKSRRQIVAAFEIERRRIERDLHDGAQQYFVAATMKLGEAAAALRAAGPDPALAGVRDLLAAAHDNADQALAALRETVAGIHPRVLSDIGLEEAIDEVIDRIGLRAKLIVPRPLPALPDGVLVTAYFFVSEALTNVAKHAPGAACTVLLAADRNLHVNVVDNGAGGAVLTPGRGLVGMRDRLEAFGGTMELSSPPGGPTTLCARIPVLLNQHEPGVVV